MKYFLTILMLISFCAADAFQCDHAEVIDGDTIRCDIADLPEIFGSGISVRLKDCDSPEIRTADKAEKAAGHKAKQELTEKVTGKQIELKNVSRGKYFRLVADVYADSAKLTCPQDKLAYAPPAFKCGAKTKCSQMSSCEEAYFYLQKCGLNGLDRDKDGIPCENICR
ncbi:MAG: thermonuclease family protein [Deferribacterales bacterium]|jgi:hypothetical protein